MHYVFQGKPALTWATRLNPLDMQDTEETFGGSLGDGFGASGDDSPQGKKPTETKPKGQKPKERRGSMSEAAARAQLVKITEDEAGDANRNAKRAVYRAIPVESMSAESRAKRTRLISQLEDELGL